MLFILIIALLVDLGIAWLLQFILLAFAVKLSLWVCFAIVIVLSFLFKRK